MRALVPAFLPLLPLAIACGGGSLDPVDPDPGARDLPLLEAERLWGTTFYGTARLPAPDSGTRVQLDRGIDAGLGAMTHYVDWADLEPAPGVYTLDGLEETLATLQGAGLVPVVNITVGDSAGYNLPDGLTDGAGGLAEGVALDDPEVLERFGALLDRVAPLVADHGGFVLLVGNEIEERLDAAPAERESYLAFVEAARDRVRAAAPGLAVGVTMTGTAVAEGGETFRRLRAVSDVVPFNHAPIRPTDFTVLPEDAIAADFEARLDAYGEDPVMIQELTCPEAESMGASEAWQAACFRAFLRVLADRPQVRFASVFTFEGFDDATCTIIQEALWGEAGAELPPELDARIRDYFCALSVVAPDGRPRPAWDVLVEGIARE